MKVLIVPTWYPSGEDKLMGIYHKEFTSALNDNGIEADMIYIERERLSHPLRYLKMEKRSIDKEDNYDVYIHRMLNLEPINYHLEMISYVHTFKKAFKSYIKKNGKPDIIHAMVSIPAGYAATKVGKKYGIPVIVTEHSSYTERQFTKKPYRKYGQYVLDHATMSGVSKFLQDVVLKYKDECFIIPNLVNVGLFKNNTKRKIEKNFELVSVCALREDKGIDIVIKAIKLLVEKGLDVHYTVIGDGFLENFYKKCAKDLNMEKYVTFLGRKSKKEISKILETQHALIIASSVETFAIPGIEALASGIPVITTDCKGPLEFVDDTTGCISKERDPESLAKAIEKVFKNYQNYDKKHLEEVANRYSEKAVANKAKEIYENILKQNGGKS